MRILPNAARVTLTMRKKDLLRLACAMICVCFMSQKQKYEVTARYDQFYLNNRKLTYC